MVMCDAGGYLIDKKTHSVNTVRARKFQLNILRRKTTGVKNRALGPINKTVSLGSGCAGIAIEVRCCNLGRA